MHRVFAIVASLGLAACGFESFEADAGPPPRPDAGRVDPTDEVDLLLVVDNSGSMTEEQSSLAHDLPRLFEALLTGDLDGDGTGDVEPLDVRVGVVTTDMGTGGFTAPTCARSDFGDDGILRTEGRTDLIGCAATYPSFLESGPGSDVEAFAEDVGCLSLVGTSGCGFEQQLEASLKALAPREPTDWTHPDYEPPTFFRLTPGHGDGENDRFVRRDSVLAVVVVTDEEDCSARDPELFDRDSTTYGGTDFNLRCFAHPGALHPIGRYVDNLLALRREPSRLVFAPIVGLPRDLQPEAGAPVDWPRLVSDDPSVRDRRMQQTVDPAMPSRLQPSCNVPGRGVAFPPVRILRVAEQLERRGAQVAPSSICQESFATPIDSLIAAIVEASRGSP